MTSTATKAKPRLRSDYDRKTGKIECPKCHRFCGKLTAEAAQHYCPDCGIEVITPQPTRAELVREINETLQKAIAGALALMPLLDQLG